MNLSPEALDFLRYMLAREVVDQVREGRGDEEMSKAWTELQTFSLLAPVRQECPYTLGHTSRWCGNEGCRES